MVRRRDSMFQLDINKVDTISLDIYFLSFRGVISPEKNA